MASCGRAIRGSVLLELELRVCASFELSRCFPIAGSQALPLFFEREKKEKMRLNNSGKKYEVIEPGQCGKKIFFNIEYLDGRTAYYSQQILEVGTIS